MNDEMYTGDKSRLIVYRPIAESLIDSDYLQEQWPHNPELYAQAVQRREQLLTVETVLDKAKSGDPIESLITNGEVTHNEAISMFSALSDVLSDTSYQRLALYLPFELLPHADWETDDPELDSAVSSFRESYLDAWQQLLSTQDVRANFVDGDVSEAELEDESMPRVVKAAHLIPILVDHGWIKAEQIQNFARTISDPVLKQSIDEALMVLGDMGQVESSPDNLIPEDNSESAHPQSFTGIIRSIKAMLSDEHQELPCDLPPRRRWWLIQQKLLQFVEITAGDLTQLLQSGELTAPRLRNALFNKSPLHNRVP